MMEAAPDKSTLAAPVSVICGRSVGCRLGVPDRRVSQQGQLDRFAAIVALVHIPRPGYIVDAQQTFHVDHQAVPGVGVEIVDLGELDGVHRAGNRAEVAEDAAGQIYVEPDGKTLGAIIPGRGRGFNVDAMRRASRGAHLAGHAFNTAIFAETNRLPFDLTEAEQELVGGYHTEYSSFKFAMFMLSEYANMITASAFMVCLFFGGWDIPWVDEAAMGVWGAVLSVLAFSFKVGLFLFLYIWVRWTFPRFRYDQLMRLGWLVMLPLGLLNVLLVGLWMALTV